MATWVSPIDSQTDPDAPLTSELGKRWDNNVVSFIEQDASSPVNQAAYHPYNKITVGDSNDGLIYDGAVDGTVSVITTPDFDAGYRYVVEWQNLTGVATGTVSINFYDTSDSLIATENYGPVGAGDFNTGYSSPTYSSDYWRLNSNSGSSLAIPRAVKLITITGTNFNSGKAYLRRRKELI